MKYLKEYLSPGLEIIKYLDEDVLNTSNTEPTYDDEGYGEVVKP